MPSSGGKVRGTRDQPTFVVQQHAARTMHHDTQADLERDQPESVQSGEDIRPIGEGTS